MAIWMAVPLFVALEVAGPSQAAANHCIGTTGIFDQGGSVSADCHGRSPGQPPGTGGASLSEGELYAAYCGGAMTGEASVQLGPTGRDMTAERLGSLGYDPSGEYVEYFVQCSDAAGQIMFRINLYYEVTPPIDPTVLRDRALARIVLAPPTIGTFPTLDKPALVRTDTWMWVQDPWTASAESDGQGFTAVTVTATPTRVDWSMGDGTTVQCFGPGEPWSRGRYEFGSSCMHTYTASSAGQPENRFAGSATMHWSLTWSINGAGQGEFATVDQTTPFTIAVGELQAVESDGTSE